jgi:DNA ligase-associated metallophosphoesterase
VRDRSGAARLEWAGESLDLLPERAAWWSGERTLFVADLHLGKGDVFRAAGIPIPSGTTRDDLTRLAHLVRGLGARRVVVLGDFFHGAASQSPGVHASLLAWREAVGPVESLVVRGNHDRHAGDPPPETGFVAVEAPRELGPFVLRHEPLARATGGDATAGEGGSHVLAGHLHPVVRLEGAGRDRLRLPCFWVQPAQIVLPAFGAFTGGARIEPRRGDRVFVSGPDGVLPVPLG